MADRKFSLILLFTLSTVSAISQKRTYSEVDLLRSKLFELDDIFKNVGRSTSDAGEGTYTRLAMSYKDFCDELEASNIEKSKNYLYALESDWIWAKVKVEIEKVDALYANFRQRLQDVAAKKTPFDLQEWLIFAKTALNDPNYSIPMALERIVNSIVQDSLFISAYQAGSKQICNDKQSPQQLLYNLYNTIVFTEIRGYAVMQYSFNLLKLQNNRTFNEETQRMKTKFKERISETLRAVKTAMLYAPRELWTCDPSVHTEDSTYSELKQLFQGYIVNEVDLNPTATCRENCGYYSFATVTGCYDNQYCAQQRRCNGKVLNCQYVDSDMWICPSARTSTRRYEYIEYENGRVYGNKGTCKRGTTKVDSWWRWLFWHCSYCMCYCDDHNTSSHRYFSLREVTSDVEENWVITGMRLKKVNKIIHFIIQQGKLLPRVAINETSVHWKKPDNFSVLDANVENGRDYHTLAWEKRAIDLDDLYSEQDEILTGVRFRVIGAHLNFEIRVTPFNFSSGTLIKPLEKSRWISNDNTDVKDPSAAEKARTEVKLDKPGIPTKIRASSMPDSRSNQYLNFVPTDLEKDVAQSTVPFIDVQPVITRPAFPLSGAGIYHKGRKGSGGYIAPRVITYDFVKHLNADLPPETTVLGVNEIPVL